MEKLKFTPEEKAAIVQKIRGYFQEELDQEIGSFDAEFLMDFFAEQLGAYFYNRGLYDAEALFSKKVDEFADSIYELERPTEFRK